MPAGAGACSRHSRHSCHSRHCLHSQRPWRRAARSAPLISTFGSIYTAAVSMLSVHQAAPTRLTLPPVRELRLAGLDWTRPKDPPFSLGAASIAAQLQAAHLPHRLASFAINAPRFDAESVVEWACADAGGDTCVCLGAFVWAEQELRAVLRGLRAAGFPGTIVLGGPQVTYTSPHSAQTLESLYPEADLFVRGYGEPALLQLATEADLWGEGAGLEARRRAAGVHLAGRCDSGAMAQVALQELESPLLSGLLPPQCFLRWELQRGCPYRCAFCQHRCLGRATGWVGCWQLAAQHLTNPNLTK